jgi:hypothetical protein
MWKSIYLLLVLSFVIYCQSQTVSPQNTIVEFKISQFGTIAGNPIIAQIDPYDSNNSSISGCALGTNPFTATVIPPSSSLQILYPSACQSGVQFPYHITFISNFARNYTVSFSYQGQAIGDSPYTIGFTFGPISPNNSIATGPGLQTANVGTPAYFSFKTYDQHNNFISSCVDESSWDEDFTIVLTQPTPIYGQIISCDPTTYIYNATYETNSTDAGFLYVQYLSNNFAQMPQLPVIISGPPYGPTCYLPTKTLNNVTEAGVPASFVLDCVDQYGNTLSGCSYFDTQNWVANFSSSPTNNFTALSVSCSATESGAYTFTYNYTVAALYNTDIYYGSPSNNVPPFTTLIKPGPPSDVIATGPGVTLDYSGNIAGIPSFFNINVADVYGNIISDCLNSTDDEWDITATPKMAVPPQAPVCTNGNMISNWTATDAEVEYSISVAYNGTAAENNPYSTNVYSNVLDANKTSLNTLNSTSVKAGITLPFSIDAFDQYGNPIVNCSRVVSDFVVQAVNLGNTSIQITGAVTCEQITDTSVLLNGTIHGTLIGTYSLSVLYNNIQIKHSPQMFTVIPGPMDPHKSFATGAGFTNQTTVVAGDSYLFYINQRDQYQNIISSCLDANYAWNVVIIRQPDSLFLNQTTAGSCNSQTGIYTLGFSINITGVSQINVYSLKNQNYAVERAIKNKGSVTVTPGAFDPNFSITTIAPSAELGDNVTVTVVPMDKYHNSIGSCTPTIAADLEIFARYQPNMEIYSTGNMSCVNVTYTGTFYVNTTGFYITDVGQYQNGISYPVGDSGRTRVFEGFFNSTFSTVSGPGVGTNGAQIVAGTFALINITVYNKNGFIIPATNTTVDPNGFNFTIIGSNNSAHQITNAAVTQFVGNSVLAEYNGTNAQFYDVSITYNDTFVGNQTYLSQIIPAAIDLNTLVASNISSEDTGTGYFDLSATDAFNNPVVVSSGLDVTLSPACSSPNVTCTPSGLLSFCQFTVQEAGVYCISIENLTSLVQYEVANSTILVATGGNGCSDEDYCNGNGLCYQDPSGSGFLCNCKNGYTGSSCSTKIKSHYMNLWLGVGLLIGLSILLLIIGVVLGCLLGRRNRGGKNLN